MRDIARAADMHAQQQFTTPKLVRALLLDDSSFDRRRIQRLGGKGDIPIQFDEAGNLEEFETAVERVQYDLIMIDYRLPRGDGLMALDTISRAERNHDVAKIMLTGNGSVDTAVQAMQSGFHDFLDKAAISPEALSRAMRNALQRAHQERQFQQQLVEQRETIRQGVVAAFSDAGVQEHLAEVLQAVLENTLSSQRLRAIDIVPQQVDEMVAGLAAPDEFIFSARRA